jgi:large subunit ribosomal protein L2
MAIRTYRPTSAGRRNSQVADFSDLTPGGPYKPLLRPKRRTNGRSANGVITVRHRGGGAKRQYRLIDFKRRKDGVPAVVEAIEYDPNRTVRIARVCYRDGERRYILAPNDLKVGMSVESGDQAEPRVGNCAALGVIPLGLVVHNVELTPGRGGQIARSAGAAVRLTAREGDYAHLVMPSGEIRKVHVKCRATIGELGNAEHNLVRIGKAGRKRHMGRRPHVRGAAMNPVSHPLGGGEGRCGAGRPPCSPTGVLSKGGKTRNRRKPSSAHIIRRRRTVRYG